MKNVRYDDFMAEQYRNCPEQATSMLNALLEDGEAAEWLVALRHLRKAFAGQESVRGLSEMSEAECAEALEAHRDPPLSAIVSVVKAMGMKLAVVPAVVETNIEQPAREKVMA